MPQRLILFILILFSFQSTAQDNDSIWSLYGQQRFDELDSICREALKKDPYNLPMNLVHGCSLADRNRGAEAIPYLERCTGGRGDGKWMEAWALVYLGREYYRRGDKELSRQSLQKCIDLNATKNVQDRAIKLMRSYGFTLTGWATQETKNIRFHFQPESVLSKNFDKFMATRQLAYDTINTYFKAELPGKIDMYVWNSNQDAINEGLGNPGFSLPEELIIHTRYNQSWGHEITHIIVHYSIRPVVKTRFINEGIAVFHDLNENSKMITARAMLKETKFEFTVEGLWKEDKNHNEQIYYPLAGAWIEFMVGKMTDEQFRAMLKNQDYESAQTISNGKLDLWIKEFESQLRTVSTPAK